MDAPHVVESITGDAADVQQPAPVPDEEIVKAVLEKHRPFAIAKTKTLEKLLEHLGDGGFEVGELAPETEAKLIAAMQTANRRLGAAMQAKSILIEEIIKGMDERGDVKLGHGQTIRQPSGPTDRRTLTQVKMLDDGTRREYLIDEADHPELFVDKDDSDRWIAESLLSEAIAAVRERRGGDQPDSK